MSLYSDRIIALYLAGAVDYVSQWGFESELEQLRCTAPLAANF